MGIHDNQTHAATEFAGFAARVTMAIPMDVQLMQTEPSTAPGNPSKSSRFPQFPCRSLATRCFFVLGPSSSPLQDVLDGVLQALMDEGLGVL